MHSATASTSRARGKHDREHNTSAITARGRAQHENSLNCFKRRKKHEITNNHLPKYPLIRPATTQNMSRPGGNWECEGPNTTGLEHRMGLGDGIGLGFGVRACLGHGIALGFRVRASGWG